MLQIYNKTIKNHDFSLPILFSLSICDTENPFQAEKIDWLNKSFIYIFYIILHIGFSLFFLSNYHTYMGFLNAHHHIVIVPDKRKVKKFFPPVG